MSTTRGIFETFANQSSAAEAPPGSPASPFAIAKETPASAAQNGALSPFSVAPAGAPAPAPKKNSPFAIVNENHTANNSKANRIPERRKPEASPFQVSEPQGFGFEAPPQALQASPFGTAPAAAPLQARASSPFSMEPAAAPAPAQPAPTPSPFGGWPQAEAAPRQEAPLQQEARIASPPQPQPVAQAPAPAAPAAPAPAAIPQPSSSDDPNSDSSYSIKQLELRAIFGVDREMTRDEIVQRARALPGIRQIARVSESDIAAVDALKTVIANLGFGSGALKLYSGSVPIEFIREGHTLLAVQTDGGFAPGVRETLMLVARELGR